MLPAVLPRTCYPLAPRLDRIYAQNANSDSTNIPTSQPAERDIYKYTYKGSDGRLKATFEQAFKSIDPKGAGAAVSEAPWEIGYQMGEQNLIWNDDLKMRLLQRAASNELSLSEEETMERIERLLLLIPDISKKLSSMKPGIIVKLLADLDHIPKRLVLLKQTFPEADVLKLAMREPSLVLGVNGTVLEYRAEQLRRLLPNLNIDKLVEEHPVQMLDVEELKKAMAEAARIMPSLDIQKTMGSDPGMIMSFQRGAQLIPYDSPYPEGDVREKGQVDDDEYSAYYK